MVTRAVVARAADAKARGDARGSHAKDSDAKGSDNRSSDAQEIGRRWAEAWAADLGRPHDSEGSDLERVGLRWQRACMTQFIEGEQPSHSTTLAAQLGGLQMQAVHGCPSSVFQFACLRLCKSVACFPHSSQ